MAFPRVTKKNVEFPSHGSLFLALEFPRDLRQFCGISRGNVKKLAGCNQTKTKTVAPHITYLM